MIKGKYSLTNKEISAFYHLLTGDLYPVLIRNPNFIGRFEVLVAEKKIKNDLETGYRLAGVASSLKDYKFCYHLNQLLSCDFRKLKDVSFDSPDRSRHDLFGIFRAEREADEVCFTVFNNKTPGAILLPEVSNFDFIIRVDGKFPDEKMKKLIEEMLRFPEVMMSAEIPLKKIKNRDRLSYEEEKEPRPIFQKKKKPFA